MTPVRRERIILLTVAIILLTALALISLAAGGFFVIPIVIGVCAWALLYWALRHQGARNPLAPPEPGLSGKWADGQPLYRTLENETRQRAIAADEARHAREDAEKLHHDDAERQEALQHTAPGDFEGPPPINPFP